MIDVEITDGGRSEAGFQGSAGDCVTRAIAIAAQLPYAKVYRDLSELNKARGGKKSARDGLPKKVYQPYIESLGFRWVTTMRIGEGVKVHVRRDELPEGRLILRLSRHLAACIDGTVHDTHDPSRGGTRAVYGYWIK